MQAYIDTFFESLIYLELTSAALVLGLIGSTLISLVAYRRRSLSQTGMLGAIVVGTTIFALGGSAWWILLIAFFASSSALSHFRAAHKSVVEEKYAKGARRDLGQVLANGALASLIAILYAVAPGPGLIVAFVGTMATVNADTWATELGVFNPHQPRLIITGRPVSTGTSGGISFVGTVAAIAGAAFIGLIATVFVWSQSDISSAGILFLAASLGGLLGSLFDSVLGATVQQIHFCPHCQLETERPYHSCGRKTDHLRGWSWLNNDGVNFISSFLGAVAATGIWNLWA